MSQVTIVRNIGASAETGLSKGDYISMLKAGLESHLNTLSFDGGLRSLLPGRVIGMKTNCLARKLNSTPITLTEAIGDTQRVGQSAAGANRIGGVGLGDGQRGLLSQNGKVIHLGRLQEQDQQDQ